jgi:hypothetical protein
MAVWRRRVCLRRRPESASEAIPDREQPHSSEAQREMDHAFGYPFELSRIVQFPDVRPVFVLGHTRSGTSAMANRPGTKQSGTPMRRDFPETSTRSGSSMYTRH